MIFNNNKKTISEANQNQFTLIVTKSSSVKHLRNEMSKAENSAAVTNSKEQTNIIKPSGKLDFYDYAAQKNLFTGVSSSAATGNTSAAGEASTSIRYDTNTT